VTKLRDLLEGRPGVVEWTYLDDLALTRAEDTPEFAILVSTKGYEEIQIRREFLQAIPEDLE